MAVDKVGVYNLALNAIGARSNISLPSENSREAEVCNLWYPVVRDQILAAAPWPEATKFDYLALINEQVNDVWAFGEARPGYRFAYAAPSDYLRAQYLTDFSRFQVANYNNEKQMLMTNAAQAILVYTMLTDNINLWSSELRMAIVYGLAANICMPLTGKPSRTKTLVQQANNYVIAARETAANTNNERYDSLPDWIVARGFTDAASQTRYLYPLGSLLSTEALP